MANESVAGTLETVARLLARLAHRFADREAILWRAGHDEDSWSALEERTLSRVREELARGDATSARAFAATFAQARSELMASSGPTTAGGARSGIPNSDDAAPTLPRPDRPSFGTTLASSSSPVPSTPFIIDAPTTNDDDPFAVTLSSSPSSKPPRGK